jgi:pantetheine-phosphate adenylyltransferase
MTRIGFFAGSFDPPTLGHMDLIERGAKVVDKLVVGVGINAEKTPWLPAADRVALLKQIVPAGVEVVSFTGLAVTAAQAAGASLMLRGVRSSGDVAFESQMALANRRLAAELDTVLLVASIDVAHISGRLVRDVHRAGGDVSVFVPPVVADALAKR